MPLEAPVIMATLSSSLGISFFSPFNSLFFGYRMCKQSGQMLSNEKSFAHFLEKAAVFYLN
jgi:hypothetical protein